MPTKEMTRLAKQAVAGAEDSLREFLLRADSEYLDQFRTPEMAAEKYLELAEESGVDVDPKPEDMTFQARAMDAAREVADSATKTAERLATDPKPAEEVAGPIVGVEPSKVMDINESGKRAVKNQLMDAYTSSFLPRDTAEGTPMRSAMVAMQAGRHGDATALLQQVLQTETRGMHPNTKSQLEAMLRVSQMLQQKKGQG
jgi:hypothetical protein|tara:strand:+ start:4675 stop:5274 length:600 start_codon:yes stop_codon:yes gene_type:complete